MQLNSQEFRQWPPAKAAPEFLRFRLREEFDIVQVFWHNCHDPNLWRTTMTITRRKFFGAALLVGTALSLGRETASAIEPVRRTGRSRMRLSLAAYSYRQYLNLTKKPRPKMTLADFIDQAALMPLDAVELTAYYFPETTPAYLAGLKGRCTRLGLDVSGTAVGNNFCTADAGRLKTQVADVKRWIEHTSRLGGKTIRIFAGNVDKGDTEERARSRCIAAIQEAAAHAGQFGIYLALDNHGRITNTIEQMFTLS